MSRFVLTAQLQLQAPNNVNQVVQQIQNQLNGVTVNLQVQNARQAQRQIQQVAQATNQATTAAERMGKAFALSVRRFAAFSIATRAVGLFTSTLGDAVQTAIDFERQLIKVSQVTGKSLGQLRGLTKQITNLSTGFGVASSDLLEVSTILAQAGLSAEDTSVALKTLAKAALAPNFDSISETAEGAIAILAQFQEGVGSLEKQLGSINAVAGAFAVEASDLIDVVRRTGGVFKASGGNLNELLALFTSVRATTRESAESIGTGLRTIFTRIQRPKTIEFLKQFGVELTDLDGKFVGPYEAVKRLSEALSGLGEGDITFIRIAEELGGFRQIGKVLPLLQQFSTAQSALNVAMKAGDSLTQDAASAQAALAVRIMKVKEEFLALIRSVTETSTFQIMANTALSLASALIKIADSIKPLLPLLASLAAFRLVKGMAGFFGGMMSGATSGRAYNRGGKVLGFARGGLVPGSGNSDTVPAMLAPGEFVIRKSSVSRLGANNLAAMNENRYADGGIVVDPNKIGAFFLRPEKGADRNPIQLKGQGGIKNPAALSQLGLSPKVADARNQALQNANIGLQGKLLGLSGGKKKVDATKILKNGRVLDTQQAREALYGAGYSVEEVRNNFDPAKIERRLNKGLKKGKVSLNAQQVPISGAISGYFPGMDDLQNSDVARIIADNTRKGLYNIILKSVDPVISALQNPAITINPSQARRGAKRIADDPNAQATTQGFAFEGLIQSITGAKLAGNQANFDFPNVRSASKSLKNMFTDASGEGIDTLIKADAKRSNTTDAIDSIRNKIVNDVNRGKFDGVTFIKKFFGGLIQKFASGGEVVTRGTIPYLKSDIIQAMQTMGLTYDDFFKKIATPNSAFPQFMIGGIGPDAKPFPKYLRPYSPKSKAQEAMETAEAEKNIRIESALESKGQKMKEYEGRTREQKEYMANRGLRRKFASGGMASAPLIDDILSNASGTLLPRPSSAIASLIKAGGGAIDIDRTLKRTIGDKAYANAKTSGAKDAVLSKYFRDDAARLNDIKTAPLTAFGKELQAAIKSGQLSPGKLSIISKSSRTRGVPEYLSQLFGIPIGNMIFTGGSSKQPAMDALRSKGPRSSRTRFATGGDVGTDTVPALLTPGEFVINRDSAQRIGYGALNRMNKVGKYASGGVVQHFASGGTASGGGGMGMFNDLGGNIAMVSAALTTILPPIDDNASAFTKLGHSALSLTTTIGGIIFALGQFGISLKANDIGKFLKSLTTMGKGGLGEKLGGFTREGGKTSRAIGESFSQRFKDEAKIADLIKQKRSLNVSDPKRAGFDTRIRNLRLGMGGKDASSITGKLGSYLGRASTGGGLGGRLAGMAGNAITKVGGLGGGMLGGAGGFAAAASGPALAITGAVAAINSMIGTFRDLDGQLKKSIEAGKVEEASRLAVAQKASEFPLIGNIIGGWSETVDTGLMTIMRGFGGSTVESTKALAASQAGAVKTQKDFEKAQKTATKVMEDFERGTISASEALTQIRAATQSANEQEKRASDFAISNTGNRAGGISGFGRNVASFLTFGAVESSSQRNTRLGKQSAEEIRQAAKFQAEAFQMESPARSAMIRSGFARGKSPKEIRDEALGVGTANDKLKRLDQATQLVSKLDRAGDKEGADAAREAVNQLTDEINQVNREMANLEKEVARAKAAFDAMNLGLRGPSATASALSANMQKFAAGLEIGGNTFVANTEFLSEAVSSAAQAMNPDDIKSAVADVRKNLSQLGLSEDLITKFENNIGGFVTAQQNYNKAFNKIRSDIDANRKAGRKSKDTPEEIKKAFAQELTAGLGGEAKKNLTAIIENIPLTTEEVDKIIAGDLSVFGDKLTEAGRKQIEEIQKIAAERAKAEQVLIDFTKKRIDAERNLVEAQKEALDLIMEGREIQAKYGGAAISERERRSNILAQSNVEGGRLGLTAMRTGSIGELRTRNREIGAAFANIESRRTKQGGLEGKAGVEADEAQKDLQKAYKIQIDTIRSLIKLEEDQLKITQEKNKLEKESMESLVKGDVEEFFKKQAAVGATAAIASGDRRLMNLYGPEALGTAALDLQRQQEAGVQELYGQQLGGAGGLVESAAGAALSARGVTDMRAAQVMAGTTAEEEASKARLRELGGMLGETGQLGVDMAEMQVNTSVVNLTAAEVKFNETLARGRKAAEEAAMAEGKSRGGLIYANRGIFVPRGTDTVPAMLTPGEFVVNRSAVQRGNNLQVLQSMNSGSSNNTGGTTMMARGGMVRYRQNGSIGPENSSNDAMTQFSQSLNEFNLKLSDNIQKLSQTNISIKLDSTSVNINLNDGGLLKALTGQVKNELFKLIESEFKVDNSGRLKRNSAVLT